MEDKKSAFKVSIDCLHNGREQFLPQSDSAKIQFWLADGLVLRGMQNSGNFLKLHIANVQNIRMMDNGIGYTAFLLLCTIYVVSFRLFPV